MECLRLRRRVGKQQLGGESQTGNFLKSSSGSPCRLHLGRRWGGRFPRRLSELPPVKGLDVMDDGGKIRVNGLVCMNDFNHPSGTPPSLKDIMVAMERLALEIQVVSSLQTFSIRPKESARRGEVATLWNHLNEMSYAVEQDGKRSQTSNTPDDEVAGRRLHALLMELARKGAILFLRNANSQ